MCRGHLTKLKWKSRLNHHENALSTHFNNIGGAVKLRHRLLWATTTMMLRLCDHGIDLHLKMKKKTCKKPHFHNIDTWKSCVRELYEMAVFWYCVSLKQFVYHQKLSTIDSKAGAYFEITMEVEREKKCEQMTKKMLPTLWPKVGITQEVPLNLMHVKQQSPDFDVQKNGAEHRSRCFDCCRLELYANNSHSGLWCVVSPDSEYGIEYIDLVSFSPTTLFITLIASIKKDCGFYTLCNVSTAKP